MSPSIEEKEYFAKGKRGIVSTALYGGRKVLVKERNPSSAVDTVAHEAAMLQLVNEHGIGPLFIALDDHQLIREFIDGEEILDWIAHARKPQIKEALLEVLAQCRALDLMGINKLEMTHPHKHILISAGRPVFIDFERARRTEKPKNLTQVCQWLTNKQLSQLLEEKGIVVSREAMLAHAKQYKQSYDVLAYERVREAIQHA